MAHEVDGYELAYTNRKSWKAKRLNSGKLVDIVPVAWSDGWRRDANSNAYILPIYYQDSTELEIRRQDMRPFPVAIAKARDPNVHPREFWYFVGVFEAVSTGIRLDAISFEARLTRRLNAHRDP